MEDKWVDRCVACAFLSVGLMALVISISFIVAIVGGEF